MSNQWISRLRKRLDDNRRYRRAMAEISALTTRDLVDMRGSRDEMHRHIYEEIYGRETAEAHHFDFGEALRKLKAGFGRNSTGPAYDAPSVTDRKPAGAGRERELVLH